MISMRVALSRSAIVLSRSFEIVANCEDWNELSGKFRNTMTNA